MSYNYWNDFFKLWRTLPASEYSNPTPVAPFRKIDVWDNPNLAPLMNSQGLADYSLQYIPEPWWGNSGKTPLQCVFINHNPFSGGPVQMHSAIKAFITANPHILDYQSLVQYEVSNYNAGRKTNFYKTCNWHRNERSRKIIRAINNIKGTSICEDDISSLLSVELIPWHTKNFGDLELDYLINNKPDTILKSLIFAANESRRIMNATLLNKPIIRTNRSRIERMLSSLSNNGVIAGYYLSPVQVVGKYNYSWDYFTIDHSNFSGIKFCRIQNLRNSLPGYAGTEDFLRRI
jgi:hypothetical protein